MSSYLMFEPAFQYEEGTGKYFFIRSYMNGMVLDVQGGDCEPGTKVIMYEMKDSSVSNQLWTYDALTGRIRSALNEMFVLELDSDNELTVQQHEFSNSGQAWRIDGAAISSYANPALVLDIKAGDTESGATICGWDRHDGSNQMWDFIGVEPRYFQIVSRMNEKVLDIKYGQGNPGDEVVMYSRGDPPPDNQLWWEDRLGNIRSKMYNLAVELADGKLVVNPFDPHNSNQWWVREGDKIVHRANPSNCLDIDGGSSDDCANVISWEMHGDTNQQWEFHMTL